MRNNKIPKTLYIATNNPVDSVGLLKNYQIKVDANDAESIAKGLSYLVANGTEKDLSKIIALHPDRELILEDAKRFDCNSAKEEIDDTKRKNNVNASKSNNVNASGDTTPPPSPSTPTNSLITSNTAHLLIGIGITLVSIATISYLVKNIKQ